MRPRERNEWVVCEDTGDKAVQGACPHHGGDNCLIVVAWVDNSHVRVQLADLRARVIGVATADLGAD